jgi:hypothetical protein
MYLEQRCPSFPCPSYTPKKAASKFSNFGITEKVSWFSLVGAGEDEEEVKVRDHTIWVVSSLANIGNFVNNRANFHDEWFVRAFNAVFNFFIR